MIHHILTLPVVSGNPVVPGAVLILGGPLLFSAHSAAAPSPAGYKNRMCHPVLALLCAIEKAPGTYRVWAEEADMARIDPTGKGLTQTEWLAAGNRSKATYWQVQGTQVDPRSGKTVAVDTVVAVPVVPATSATPAKPWTINGMTIKSAAPTTPSVFAGYTTMKGAIIAARAIGDMEP